MFSGPLVLKLKIKRRVFRLNKGLYGLKEAPLAWYSKIDDFFKNNGFERSVHVPTLYVKTQGMTDMVIASMHVDDIIYTSSSSCLISEFKESMMEIFEMTDLGELKYFSGLEIIQTHDGIFMSQRKFVEDTLEMFKMLGCKTVSTPMNLNEELKVDDDTGMADARPTKRHLAAAKKVLRYLEHIQMHHIIRELMAEGEVFLESCSTEDQLAQIMTKSLPSEKFKSLCTLLGVTKLE
ncbi:retrovirus-related pol polyprotein from transposon TNT 1-94 [Tanacetum coccineum]